MNQAMKGVDRVSGSPGTTGKSCVVGSDTAEAKPIAGSKHESKLKNIICGNFCLKENISLPPSGSWWMSDPIPFEFVSNINIVHILRIIYR